MDGLIEKVLCMSNNRLYFGFVAVIMVFALMFGTVSAISVQAEIGGYETTINRDSTFIVPVSLTSDESGTVSVILYPKDGLSCDVCVSEIVFDTAGTKEMSFTASADNIGTYDNPFDIEVTMDGSVIATATAGNILSVNQAPILLIDFNSDINEVSTGDIVQLTLSLSVTGPIDGISVDLESPTGWNLVSGNKSYDVGKVTGTYNTLWDVKADNPSASNDFSVTITASNPVNNIVRDVSVNLRQTIVSSSSTEKSSSKDHNTPINTTATNRPQLVPGTGLRENTKLQSALENVWSNKNMNQDAIDNMMRISESISSQISMEREINVASGKSNMHTSLKYNGKNQIKDFVLYDIVPKSFATSAKDITVTVSGARVEIVEDDPEFAIIFDTVSPGDTLSIDYVVNAEIDADIVSSFTSEVYATEVVVDDQVCAQVMTPAINPATDECVVYSTPCDVPEGWSIVGACPSEPVIVDNDDEILVDDVLDNNISEEPTPQPSETNLYKYMILISLFGIVSMLVVLQKNKQKK